MRYQFRHNQKFLLIDGSTGEVITTNNEIAEGNIQKSHWIDLDARKKCDEAYKQIVGNKCLKSKL
jgi:hypothetical protein